MGWRRGLVLALELTLEGPGSRHSSAPGALLASRFWG